METGIMNYPANSEIRQFREFLFGFNFTHTLTFNMNNTDYTLAGGIRKLRKWDAYMNRRILGRNWFRAKPDERLFYFAFPEHGEKIGGLHFHIIAKVNDGVYNFNNLAEKMWEKVSWSGSSFITELKTDTEIEKWATYISKEFYNNKEDFILPGQFSTA